jgi:hypothetical protein
MTPSSFEATGQNNTLLAIDRLHHILSDMGHVEPGLSALLAFVFDLEPPRDIQGYFSPKRAGYFVWESGYFREGSLVRLGASGRIAEVFEVGGVGRNFFMMRLREVGNLGAGKVTTQGLVVSFDPINIRLSFTQRIKLRFLKPFLKTFKDFADEEEEYEVYDDMEKF